MYLFVDKKVDNNNKRKIVPRFLSTIYIYIFFQLCILYFGTKVLSKKKPFNPMQCLTLWKFSFHDLNVPFNDQNVFPYSPFKLVIGVILFKKSQY